MMDMRTFWPDPRTKCLLWAGAGGAATMLTALAGSRGAPKNYIPWLFPSAVFSVYAWRQSANYMCKVEERLMERLMDGKLKVEEPEPKLVKIRR